ncbi:MAG TPA: glycosyltransferase, partial [Beijerinckiaceae bacterium]|nr:glycosyltransferase [Beijerinckiaceae bacterium]
MELALSLAWCVAVAVLILRAFGQRNALRRLEPAADPQDCAKVAFIVPARDEAANIGACLASLTAQSCSGARPSIVVVDDHSSDATAAIVAAAAGADPCVRLMRAPSLPPGWTGKSHACWIAARALPR